MHEIIEQAWGKTYGSYASLPLKAKEEERQKPEEDKKGSNADKYFKFT